MPEAPQLGFVVDTSALVAAKQAVGQLTDAAGKLQGAVEQLGKAEQVGAAQAKLWGDQAAKQAQNARDAAAAAGALGQAQGAGAGQARQAAAAQGGLTDSLRKAGEAARALGAGIAAVDWNKLGAGMQSLGGQMQGLTGQMLAFSAAVGGGAGGGMGGGAAMALTGLTGTVLRLAPAFGPAGIAVGALAAGFVALGAAAGGALGPLAQAQDRAALQEARLRGALGTTGAARTALKDLRSISDETGTSVATTADAFLRFARANDSIGATQRQLLQMTENVQKLGVTSGASQADVAGGLMQFSQALSRGKLQGDELASISERFPDMIKVIADGLGVTTGQVKAMGTAGELTADKLIKALLGATDTINANFARMPQTTEQAFNRVGNAWDALLTTMGKRLDASGIMQAFARKLQEAIDAANRALRPEGLDDRMVRLEREAAQGRPAAARAGRWGRRGAMDAAGAAPATTQAEVDFLAAQYDAMAASSQDVFPTAKTDRENALAPFNRTKTIIGELNTAAAKTDEMRSKLEALKEGLRVGTENRLQLTEDADIKKLEALPGQIAAVERQLRDMLPAFEQYKQGTADLLADLARYGEAGEAIGGEIRQLMARSAKDLKPLSEDEARAAVFARRAAGVQGQAQGVEDEIKSLERLNAARGRGRRAEIEAEASTKAQALALQRFGRTDIPEAQRAIGEYESALRRLIAAQKEQADQQALQNAEMERDVELVRQRAIRAGGTEGDIEDAVARERFRQRRLAITGGAEAGPLAGEPPAGSVSATLIAGPPAGSLIAALLAPHTGPLGAPANDAGSAPASGGAAPSAGGGGALSAAQMRDYFVAQGWSAQQAAGIAANLQHESMGRAGAVGDGGRAYGLAQWHPDRQANFQAWAGRPIQGSTAEQQLAFIQHELTAGKERGAGDALRRAQTAQEAGAIVSARYERPLRRAEEAAARGATAARLDGQPVGATALRVVDVEEDTYGIRRGNEAERAIRANERAERDERRLAGVSALDRRRYQQERAREEEAGRYGDADRPAVLRSAERRDSAADTRAIEDRRRAVEDELELGKRLLAAEKLTGVEREQQIAWIQRQNEMRQSGLPYTDEQTRAEERLTQQLVAQNRLREQQRELQGLARDVGSALSDAMYDAAVKGEGFRKVVKNLMDDLQRMLWQQLVTRPLQNAISGAVGGGGGTESVLMTMAKAAGSAITSYFTGSAAAGGADTMSAGMAGAMGGSVDGLIAAMPAGPTRAARGHAFAGGEVVPFAAGGVVAGPTFFPMARGRTGLMGEAGAEAVMPLGRDAAGRLGVRTIAAANQNAAAAAAPAEPYARAARQAPRVTINVHTPNADSFRLSQGQIAAAAQRVVMRAGRHT